MHVFEFVVVVGVLLGCFFFLFFWVQILFSFVSYYYEIIGFIIGDFGPSCILCAAFNSDLHAIMIGVFAQLKYF